MRRVLGLGAGVVVVALAGCAQSESTLDDTLPTIAVVSTTTTSSTTTTTITPIPITAGATAVVTPAPITAPPPPATTTAPPARPTPGPTAAAPAPTAAAPAPTAAVTSTTAAATTTTSIQPPSLTPIECTAAALDAADASRPHEAPSCLAGWAFEPADCGPDPCLHLFQATPDGWAGLDLVNADCPTLTGLGVPDVVATQIAGECPGEPTTPRVIRPDDEGPFVEGVQAALVARGYDIEVDGIFGPRTTSSVRHFQQSKSLEPDGLVGPNTQAALFAPD